jgi:hypothetical protein
MSSLIASFLTKQRILTAFEPEQANDTSNTNIILEDIRNTHTGIEQLLTAFVGNGRDERRRLSNETEFLRADQHKNEITQSELRTCAHL